jgi:hypothetical protein
MRSFHVNYIVVFEVFLTFVFPHCRTILSQCQMWTQTMCWFLGRKIVIMLPYSMLYYPPPPSFELTTPNPFEKLLKIWGFPLGFSILHHKMTFVLKITLSNSFPPNPSEKIFWARGGGNKVSKYGNLCLLY